MSKVILETLAEIKKNLKAAYSTDYSSIRQSQISEAFGRVETLITVIKEDK